VRESFMVVVASKKADGCRSREIDDTPFAVVMV
jgi:hypothetical protein